MRLSLSAFAAAFLLALTASAQSPSPFEIKPIPVGLHPLGIDTVSPPAGLRSHSRAIVANGGEDSVSILDFSLVSHTIQVDPNVTKISGIPSPYDVAACPRILNQDPQYALVSSPSQNQVRVLRVPDFGSSSPVTVVGVLQVGSQPHSLACWIDARSGSPVMGASSNLGDNSLTIFNVETLTVTGTIPNVPASSGFHGIGIIRDSATKTTAIVAGSDADVVTLADTPSLRTLIQIPVNHPTAVLPNALIGNGVAISSAGDGSIRTYAYPNYDLAAVYPNLPNPQDAVDSGIGLFAVIGGQDSIALWTPTERGQPPEIASGIPEAAALSAVHLQYALDAFNLNIRDVWAVLVSSTSSNSVFLAPYISIPVPPPPQDFGISNSASFISQVAPDSLVSALSVTTGVSQSLNASSFGESLPKVLGGVSMKIGGTLNFNSTTGNWDYTPTGAQDVPLVFVGPNQVNFQIPPGTAPGNAVPVQLTKPDGTTLLSTVTITATAPGIFSVLMNGQGQGAVLNQDNSQNGVSQLIAGAKPATRGSIIQIFATGGGDTNPTLTAGDAAPASGNPLVMMNAQPTTVSIGGIGATVKFSGMAPGWVGLWQINAEVPANVTPGSAVPLSVSIGGVQSNTVTIAIQ